MRFPIRNPANYLRLSRLPADEAIACYLNGKFTIGEEPALHEAIKKGLSLPLTEEKLEDILLNCMNDEVSVEECKKRLQDGASQ